MHSGLFLPTFSRHTLQHVMQPYGEPFKLAWAPLRRTRHAPLGTSPCSRPASASWDYRRAGTGPAAYWAAWADARSVLRERCPAFSDWAVHCLRLLVVEGWTDVPSWELVEQGARPPDRKVAREAVGPEGHVVPQQWLVNTTAPGIAPDDRRRLDLVIYGAAPLKGGALCCDATLVSPLARDGEPHPGAAAQGWSSGKQHRRQTVSAASSQVVPQQFATVACSDRVTWLTMVASTASWESCRMAPI